MKIFRTSLILTILTASLFLFSASTYADFDLDSIWVDVPGGACQVTVHIVGFDEKDKGDQKLDDIVFAAIDAARAKLLAQGGCPSMTTQKNPFKQANKDRTLIDVSSGGNSTHVVTPNSN